MRVIASRTHVEDLTARQVTDFLLNCTDAAYQAWWPGTHRELHQLVQGPHGDHVGAVVLMDEYIGNRRVRMTGMVTQAVAGRRIEWRLGRHVRLPVRLRLDLTDRNGGVDIHHTITAGWRGLGRAADPLFRLYITPRFAATMDAHVHTEFALLRDRVRDQDLHTQRLQDHRRAASTPTLRRRDRRRRPR